MKIFNLFFGKNAKKDKNDILIGIIFLIGLFWRLIIILFQTHVYDSLNIIALIKSVADTGNLTDGFFALKNKGIGEIQLYGKIFYQLGVLWLLFLEKLRILEIKYLFDVKSYQSFYSYLEGFLRWGVLNYQLISIKLFQFIFDFLTLFFLIKIFHLLNYSKKSLITIFLFWALYPLLPYTGYVLFQSDVLLLVTILGSLYFILKYEKKKNFIDLLSSIFFISLGTAIKQVPILFFPLILILFSENFFGFIKIIFCFFLSYFVFSQLWADDVFLIKKFLVNSPEPLKLFNFNLNGVSVFFVGYLFLIFLILKKRTEIKEKLEMVIIFYTLIISMVYVTYDIHGLFVQFNLWIAPILLLISLKYYQFSPFLILPLVGFLKRALEDNDVIIGSFGPSFGSPLHSTIKYQYFIQRFVHPEVFMFLIRTIFVLGYCFLIYLIIQFLRGYKTSNKKNLFPNFIFKTNVIILSVFFFYNFLVITDLSFKKSTALLTKYNYEEKRSELIGKTPFLAKVYNKDSLSINGIDLKLSKKAINYNNPLVIEILDDNLTLLDRVNFSLYDINNIHDELTFIKFNRSIKEKKFVIKIYNKNPGNEVLISITTIKSLGDKESHYAGYDQFYTQEAIKIIFPKETFYINLRGDYSFKQMLHQFKYHIIQKPKFYLVYFSLLTILFVFIIFFLSKLPLFYFQRLFE